MTMNSRLTKRYGPGGYAGLVNGMANARALTSDSFMLRSSRYARCRPSVRLFATVDGKVEGRHSSAVRRPFQRLGMPQGADRIVVSGIPVVGHAGAGKLVVLGLNLVVLRAINQVHDLVDLAIRDSPKKLAVLGLEHFRRDLVEDVGQRDPNALNLLELIGVGPRPAGILNLLLPRQDIVEIARQLAARTPQVDLEYERVEAGIALHHPLQRRVRDETAVPIQLAVHLDGGTTGRQRAGRHDVLGPDLVGGGVEIHEVAAANIDRAHAEPHLAGVEAIEIDQPLQRAAQRRGVVPAGGLGRARRSKVRRRQSRLEKAGSALDQGGAGAQPIEK